ncbi:MAG: glutamyl-tRNA reductase, partial [Candidatus Bathyarchaeota archaeon]
MNLRESEKHDFCESLKSQSSIDEVVLLQTCNRFEVYLSGSGVQQGIAHAQKVMLERFGEKIRKHMIVDQYTDAVKHLFRTVSSLNSLIIGENQILAQVKEAYEFAVHYQFTHTVLNLVFQKALSIGKKVRHETEISKGKVSISSAAVDLANQYNPLKNKKIIIIGTGKMASLLAQYLNKFRPLELIVIGRTPSRILNFCETYSCTSIPFSNLSKELRTTDVLFSVTSCPSVLIKKEMIKKVMNERKQSITLIDIAVPPDIDPAVKDISLVNYFSITDLRDISYQNMVLRKEEMVKVRAILQNELVDFNRNLQEIHK